MKRFKIIIGCLLFCLNSSGQNIVLNGSFEGFTTCPVALNNLTGYCNSWTQFSDGTPDYYRTCASSSTVGIPVNYPGTQAADQGSAYTGVATYPVGAGPYVNMEYIAGNMTPMQAGVTYEVSMSVSLADNYRYATDGLGVYFYNSGPVSYPGNKMLPVTAQILFSNFGYGIISDKTNWVRLWAAFTADSAYDHIVIGNFKDSVGVQVYDFGPAFRNSAYYYIDSVTVIRTNLYMNFTNTIFCPGDTVRVPYLVTGGYFNTGNTFTLQLSNAAGSFASPFNIGTVATTSAGTITGVIPASVPPGTHYRVRIVATNPGITSTDNRLDITIKPSPVAAATINSPLCEGKTLSLGVTSNIGANWYKWTEPNATVDNLQYVTKPNVTQASAGDYIAELGYNGCIGRDTVTLVVKPNPVKPQATVNSPVCSGQSLSLASGTTAPGATYTWTGPAGFTSQQKDTSIGNVKATAAGTYIVTALLNGCSTKDTTTVIIIQSPVPVITGTASLCLGENIRLHISDTLTGVVYNCTGPAGFNITAVDTTIVNAPLSASGKYIVLATASGCMGSDTFDVLVKPLPANPSAMSNSPVCSGAELILSAAASTPGAAYSWSGPDSFTADTQITAITNATVEASGIYYVTANLDGCTATDSTNVVIKPTPPAPKLASNSPVHAGKDLILKLLNAYPGAGYTWHGPDSFSSMSSGPVITNAQTAASGTYIVTATLDGCTSSGLTIVVVYDVADTGMFRLYPNPNKGVFTISGILYKDQQVPLRIFNAAGQEVYYEVAETTNRLIKKDISIQPFVSTGVYILQLRADGKMKYFPFTVQR